MKEGKLPENILLRSVIKPLRKVRTGRMMNSVGLGEDCAVFASSDGQNLVSGMNSGVLHCEESAGVVFHSAINTVAAKGAKPVGVLLSLTMPTICTEADLKRIMNQLIAEAGAMEIDIAGGHTESVKGLSAPLLTVTAFGEIPRDVEIRKAQPGDDLVITGNIALAGTYLLAATRREELLKRYPASFIDEAILLEKELSVVPEAAVATLSGACAMHDASHGGIFTAMWEMAQGAGIGLEVVLRKLPIRQETVEICDYLDINPYELQSQGCLLVATPDGHHLAMQMQEKGLEAQVVGRFTKGPDRVILNGEERRFLEPFRGDNVIL